MKFTVNKTNKLFDQIHFTQEEEDMKMDLGDFLEEEEEDKISWRYWSRKRRGRGRRSRRLESSMTVWR